MLWEMLTGERPDASSSGAPMRTRPSGVHRDLDTRHDKLVSSFLTEDPAGRPEDAFAARKALGAFKWPNTIERVAAPRVERQKSDHPKSARLAPEDNGTWVDTWLARRVVTLDLDA